MVVKCGAESEGKKTSGAPWLPRSERFLVFPSISATAASGVEWEAEEEDQQEAT
jgi:hypothetical protein